MAYANEAQVLYCLGMAAVDTDYFTSANITLAGAEADAWVEEIYSDAAAADKVLAAGHYAAYVLLRNRAGGKHKGLTHSGTSGSPAKMVETSTATWHLNRAYEILVSNVLNTATAKTMTNYEPKESGSW